MAIRPAGLGRCALSGIIGLSLGGDNGLSEDDHYRWLRDLLFLLPPELSHEVALRALGIARPLGLFHDDPASVGTRRRVMGLFFPNPVGLAAGLDKNGICVTGLGALGFGFVELGTVTPRAQRGNRRPRLFRLRQEGALINRLGFNNRGVDQLVRRVQRARYSGVIGVNIGKNRDTPQERAVDDYLYCLQRVYGVADYVTVNLSSPNTPGLRALQFGDALDSLLRAIVGERERLTDVNDKRVPLAVKLAPDLEADEVRRIGATLVSCGVEAVIATNTTISREGVDPRRGRQSGGLSGRPLLERSTEVLATLHRELGDALALIGVGGVMDAEGARAKVEAGADLIQIYTGFVYRGPRLIREVAGAFEHSLPSGKPPQ